MRDSDIPTIFNPRRVRTPSVVVTGDEQPRGSVPNGPFASSAHLQHTDSGKIQMYSHIFLKLQLIMLINVQVINLIFLKILKFFYHKR